MAQQKTSALLPAYLAVGEDSLKRRTVIERSRKRIAQEGSLDFNHDEFDGERANGADIVSACNTLPFASPLRLVEVTHVEKLGKADADLLVSYLEAPNESTVLSLSGEKLAKNTRLYKAVAALGKQAVIDCAPVKRYELANNVRSMAVGHGFTLSPQAAEKLVERVGEDTMRLNTELAKIALAHEGSDPVSAREIEALVARTSEVKPWEFVDAFAARNTRRCLALMPLLGSTSPYALIAMCTTRIRELICAKSLANRGEGNRLAETLKVPAWRVKNHIGWSQRFTDEELQRALITARDCERSMKSGADPDVAFKSWFIQVTSTQNLR